MGSTPQIGQNIFYASQNGCKMDCVISTGLTSAGGTPTDNTTALQALLTYASGLATVGAKVILDGCSLISRTLTFPGNLTIEGTGWDSGLFLKAASNVAMIIAGNASTGAANVTLKNFQFNANSANQTVQFETFGAQKITRLRLENVYFYSPKYFNTDFLNCTDVVVDGCRFESPTVGSPSNTDGVHLDGGCTNVRINNCWFQTNDDAIALNAPEGNGGVGANISNVAVSNCVFNNCEDLLRAYGWVSGSDQFNVNGVVLNNCVGTFSPATYGACNVHIFGGTASGSKPIDTIRDYTGAGVTFSGSGFTPAPVVFADPCGSMVFKNYKWLAPADAHPMFSWIYSNAQVSSLLIEGCSIYRNTAGNSAAYLLSANSIAGSLIKKLTIRGFGIDNEQGQSYAAIPYLIDMLDLTITELVIDALDSTLITALVNPTTGFTGIGSISGAGVLATGFQIPDSVMANNTPYISATGANAGKPCIKLGGTVYPYAFA